jgi:hypothetical protein
MLVQISLKLPNTDSWHFKFQNSYPFYVAYTMHATNENVRRFVTFVTCWFFVVPTEPPVRRCILCWSSAKTTYCNYSHFETWSRALPWWQVPHLTNVTYVNVLSFSTLCLKCFTHQELALSKGVRAGCLIKSLCFINAIIFTHCTPFSEPRPWRPSHGGRRLWVDTWMVFSIKYWRRIHAHRCAHVLNLVLSESLHSIKECSVFFLP